MSNTGWRDITLPIIYILISSFSVGFGYWFYFQDITLGIVFGQANYFMPDNRLTYSVIYSTTALILLWFTYSLILSKAFKTGYYEVLNFDSKTYLPFTVLIASSFKYFYYVRLVGYPILFLTGLFFAVLKIHEVNLIRKGKLFFPKRTNTLLFSLALISYLIFSTTVLSVYDIDRDGFKSAFFYGRDCDDFDDGFSPGVEDVPNNGVDENCDGEDFVYRFKDDSKYNVIFIIVDTLRADHLGYAGYERNTSSNIDKLATESVIFENTFSVASCTFPSVNSILTSKHSSLFYQTPVNPLRPATYGIIMPKPVETIAGVFKREGYYTKAIITSPVVDRILGRGDHGAADDFYHINSVCLRDENWVRTGFRSTECTTNETLIWLERYRKIRPFFLFMHYLDPHHPYEPPPPFDSLYANYVSDKDYINKGNPNSIRSSILDKTKVDVTKRDIQHLIDLYDSEINYLDHNLGLVFSKLEQLGLMNNTLIVFTSDHGEGFLEHSDSIIHCYNAYNEQLHIPLFIHNPDIKPSKKITEHVSSIDITPTILDLLDIPFNPSEFDGRSIKPLFSNETLETEFINFFDVKTWDNRVNLRGIQNENGKLIYNMLTGETVFYDLEEYPTESVNLWDKELNESLRLKDVLFEKINISDEKKTRIVEIDPKVKKILMDLGYL